MNYFTIQDYYYHYNYYINIIYIHYLYVNLIKIKGGN